MERWPKRARLTPGLIDLFEHFFTPTDFAKLKKQIELLADESVFIVAENDAYPEHQSYDYEEQGFPQDRPTPSAEQWFGVQVKPGAKL
jgi:hypothetical protein